MNSKITDCNINLLVRKVLAIAST